MSTIFVLQVFRQQKPWMRLEWEDYDEMRERKERQKEEYPQYELEKEKEGIFLSLDSAEGAMRKAISESYRKLYCCYIAELPAGTMARDFLENNLSLRLYDGDGEKLDERLFKSRPFADLAHSENYGRRPEECRFHEGDVVEYLDGLYDHGTLGVVDRIILEQRDTPIGDDTDDGYQIWRADWQADNITIDEYGETNLNIDHIRCTEIFAPHYPFSDTVKKRIENIREMMEKRKKGSQKKPIVKQ